MAAHLLRVAKVVAVLVDKNASSPAARSVAKARRGCLHDDLVQLSSTATVRRVQHCEFASAADAAGIDCHLRSTLHKFL